MTDEKMQRAIELVRRRCCLYPEEDTPWMKKNGIFADMIGDEGVGWLVESGVLARVEEESEYYFIDRVFCTELFVTLSTDEHAIDKRFCSNPGAALVNYRNRVEELEEQVDGQRMWMFFREIVNAVRVSTKFTWEHKYAVDFERKVL